MTNTGRGVVILAQGRRALGFVAALHDRPPALARISSFEVRRVKSPRLRRFTIQDSLRETAGGVEVLPDLATCPDCRADISDERNRRTNYPFTNCTQCGPRYTIIESLPYDRPRTTMRRFTMCPDCRGEYSDPADRRFHAQPNACPICGPRLTLATDGPEASNPLSAAAKAILSGRIVAIKSLGGFQLACDGRNSAAVLRLRRRKHRSDKPLALMCASVATIRRFCRVNPEAKDLLLSPAAPIVLMRKLTRPKLLIADSVAPANPNLGVMLAYTPLHVTLFRLLRRLSDQDPVLVMTSANRKDDPIAKSEQELGIILGTVPDLVLAHDRPIANRCDDSVIQVGKKLSTIFVRRARGYAPLPVELGPMFHVKHPVLAVGPEFKNTFCLAAGNRAFLSPHIGAVETPAGAAFWFETLDRYCGLTGIKPEMLACDLHPDYASTRLAEKLSRDLKLPLVRVQHHFAHALSVMAEHGLAGPALALVFDGTGYGTDGATWGCEFLLIGSDLSWTRVGQLGYLRLANAWAEVANPTLVAREYLAQTENSRVLGSRGFRSGSTQRTFGPLKPPATSSLGRLFDAVAAITGACRKATFDGQAAIALEASADSRERGHWFRPDLLDFTVSPAVIRPEPVLQNVSRETIAGLANGLVAARFHNTLAHCAAELTRVLCTKHSVGTVCLSGGSFQNSVLRGAIINRLEHVGLRVYMNEQVPVNDGGVSLGQVIAASATAARRVR